jgi:hypothetical protein
MQQLVKAGKSRQAYELALEHRGRLEGRPGFDLYYGIAAVDAGHVSEGVLALERVLAHHPDHGRARVELARGHFLLGDNRRARRQFRRVLANDPPQAVREKVRRFLAALQARERAVRVGISGGVEIGVGYDSNVNVAPDEERIDIYGGLGTVRLQDESRETADAVVSTAADLAVGIPLSAHWRIRVGANARQRTAVSNELFDQDQGTARAGIGYRGRNLSARLDLNGTRSYVGERAAGLRNGYFGGEPYMNLVALRGHVGYGFGNGASLSTFGQAARQRYPGQAVRDARLLVGGVGGGYAMALPGRPRLKLTLLGGRQKASEDSTTAEALAGKRIQGGQLGLRLHPAARWRVRARFQVRQTRYGAEHFLFQERRRDNRFRANLEGRWQCADHWSLTARLAQSRNDSSIPLYAYDRTRALLITRYEL